MIAERKYKELRLVIQISVTGKLLARLRKTWVEALSVFSFFHFCICILVYECMQVLHLLFPLTCDDCTIKNEFVVYINMVNIEIQCPLNYCRNITNKANASFLLEATPLYQTWLCSNGISSSSSTASYNHSSSYFSTINSPTCM